MRVIRSLQRPVQESLRTSVTISSYAQVAEELVLNAIDAGATTVEIAVDPQAFYVQVRDNGCGTPFDQLDVVCQRYATRENRWRRLHISPSSR